MRTTVIISLLMLALVAAACGSSGQPQLTNEVVETTPAAAPQDTPAAIPATSIPAAGSNPTCPSEEANKLGAAIAKDYAFTSTEQVMGWFCNGAEFEDILVALETADQTGASAEEMLEMLAAGMTWEEIWQVVGLTE